MPSKKSRVLIVEDDREIGDLVRDRFALDGFDTTLVDNGSEAAGLIAREHYDAIITDLSLPCVNGIELIARAKSSTHNAATPVFVESGTLGQGDNLARLHDLKIIEIIEKPFDPVELVKRVTSQVQPKSDAVGYSSALTTFLCEAVIDVARFHTKDQSVHFVGAAIKRASHLPGTFGASIPLYGTYLYGAITVSCEMEWARQLMTAAFGASAVHLSEENAQGMVSELTNLIAGKMKQNARALGIDMVIGLPDVRPRIWPHAAPFLPFPTGRLTFASSAGKLWLEFCFGEPFASNGEGPRRLPIYSFSDEKQAAKG